ncbi:Ig-like domain repeat protein, partial [Ureibacillus manganicus]
QFTIDKTAPIITEVEEGKHYQSVAPAFNEGTALLTKDGGTGSEFVTGTELTENGQYTLEVTDAAGNKTSVQFTVDNQAPVINGVIDGEIRNSQFTPTFNEGTGVLSLNGGEFKEFISGSNVSDEGQYMLEVTDEAGNKTTVQFTIDKTAPIITNVEEGKHYQSVAPTFNEGTAILTKDGGTGTDFVSGTEITENGIYTLEVTDAAGNKTSVRFTVDNQAPVISGVVNEEIRNSQFTPTFNEGTGRISKNGDEFKEFISGSTVSDEGQYTLEVIDEAGNATTVQFTIDKTAPIITNVEDSKHYQSVAPAFNEGTAILTKDGGVGTAFVSGTELTENGRYTLEVTDAAGNKTSVQFTVDNQAPEISGVVDGEIRNSQYTPTFNEGTGRISKDDGEFKEFISGSTVSDEGHYKLEVEDLAGNKTTVQFTIDKTAPIIIEVEEGKHYQSVAPAFNEGTAILTKDGEPGSKFVSGTRLIENSLYTLEVTDAAGNKSRVQFTVDNIPPVINGLDNGEIRNSQFIPTFNEGTGRISKNGGAFESYTSGTVVDQEGQYTLEVKDEAGNVKIVRFTIDKTAPIITEVEDGKHYQSAAPVFNEGTAILTIDGGTGEKYVSGTRLIENGLYMLEVTDAAGNKSSVQFTVDNIPPVISGLDNGEIRNSQFIPTFNEGTGRISKNDSEFDSFLSGTPVVEDGKYTLEVTDEAGNVTTFKFTIDKTAPIITEVEDGKHYQSVAPAFNEGTAILTKDGGTGKDFVSGTKITENGQYTLEVTDAVGHKTTVSFTIDNVPPEITGKQNETIFKLDQTYTDKELTILFNEGTAKLSKDNGAFDVIETNHLVIDDGVYVLEVSDLAGNKTVANFVIDRTVPIIHGVENGMSYQRAIPTFTETTAKLSFNGGEEQDFVSGTEISDEGEYVLRVIDPLNRETMAFFKIDHTAPIVVSANLTTTSGFVPTKAGINDVVTLLVTANESVTISDVVGKIGGTTISKAVVDDLGDNNPTTYGINITISEQGLVNGTVSLEFKMTDIAGNSQTINTESLSGIGTVDVDTVTPLMQSSSVMADDYVDLKFSEPVYGGDKNALGPLEAADFNAVLNKIGGDFNPLIVTVSHITAIDGVSPLVGGETEVRVHLIYTGAKVQGDKIEIRPVAGAILDYVGNATSISESSGLKSLTPLVTYEWSDSQAEDILVITSSHLNMSTYTNVKLRLAGDGRGDANVFLTNPTPIGGDDRILISVSSGWDNAGAYFGSTANGVFAQAVGRNRIQFTANTQYAPDFRQDHFYVILQDINNPSILTIIDLNIDSKRANTIIRNSN